MSEIPEDVREAARRICSIYEPSEKAICAAIMEERERCGAIAAKCDDGEITDAFEMGWSAACLQMRGDILGWERVLEEEE